MFDLRRIGGQPALHELLNTILDAGELALGMQKAIFKDTNAIRRKGDASPVTEADEAVKRSLEAHLRRQTPKAAFLGEEEGKQEDAAELRWIVDPIDGTRAFIRGMDTWSVLVGLEADDEPVLGIAYMPAAGDLFVAARGHGATGNGRPLRLSSVDTLSKAAITHGALSQFAAGGVLGLLPKLEAATDTQRGFADFDGYRRLLFGQVDAMIDPSLEAWDMCAPAVLVREAGGRFTDFAGVETIHGSGAIASNGLIHDELIACIQ